MVPVTIYLDEETEEKIRIISKAKNISVSQWVANLIRENPQNKLPKNFFCEFILITEIHPKAKP